MTWLRLDDGYYRHPKIVRAGRDARDLDVAGMLYAAANSTDGFLPAEVLPQLATEAGVKRPEQLVARLLEVVRWEPAEGGWMVHDFLQYNPSREEVEAERQANRDRVNAWRERKAAQRSSQNGRRNGVHAPLVTPHVMAPPGNGVHAAHVTPPPAHDPSPAHDPAHDPIPVETVSVNGASQVRPAAVSSSAQTPRAKAPVAEREPDDASGAAEEIEPLPDLELFAVETAKAFGEPRLRRDYWRGLTAAYRASDHDDPAEFLLVAHRARDQTLRQKPRQKRRYFEQTLRNLLTGG